MYQAIRNMVRAIRVLYKSPKDHKNVSEEANVIEARLVTALETQKDGKLENKSGEGANNFCVFPQNAKYKKASHRKRERQTITKIVETAVQASMNLKEVKPQKGPREA